WLAWTSRLQTRSAARSQKIKRAASQTEWCSTTARELFGGICHQRHEQTKNARSSSELKETSNSAGRRFRTRAAASGRSKSSKNSTPPARSNYESTKPSMDQVQTRLV